MNSRCAVVAGLLLFSGVSNAAISINKIDGNKVETVMVESSIVGDLNNPYLVIPQLTEALTKAGYKFEPNTRLGFKESHVTVTGFAQKYFLYYKNIPVTGNILVASFNKSGNLETVSYDLPGKEISEVDFAVSDIEAFEKSKHEAGKILKSLNFAVPSAIQNAELIVVKNKEKKRVLAWKLELGAIIMYVDASGEEEGSVIGQEMTIKHFDTNVFLGTYGAHVVNLMTKGTYYGTRVYDNESLTSEGQILSFFSKDTVSLMSGIYQILTDTLNIYLSSFGLNSFDGNGAKVNAIYADDMAGNAAWAKSAIIIGADSPYLSGLATSVDVIGHEFTHAVIDHSSKLMYRGQSGALNESLADIFGEYIEMKKGGQGEPWLIGNNLKGAGLAGKKALREFREPKNGATPQPGHMSDINTAAFSIYSESMCDLNLSPDNCGVHVLSGIPNRAFAFVVDEIGWDSAIAIYYRVMSLRLHPMSNFTHFRNQVVEECRLQKTEKECDAVVGAFKKVGL